MLSCLLELGSFREDESNSGVSEYLASPSFLDDPLHDRRDFCSLYEFEPDDLAHLLLLSFDFAQDLQSLEYNHTTRLRSLSMVDPSTNSGLTRGLGFGTFKFMDSDFIIRLTFGLYRVTEILSTDSVLRSKTEESASRLLIDLILLTKSQNLEGKNKTIFRALTELEMLLGYLQDIQRLRVINDKNFIVLEREYAKVRRFLDFERQRAVEPPVAVLKQQAMPTRQAAPILNSKGLNARQERMLEILRNKEKAQVWELKKLLPEVTKRTLRRDLDDLLNRNLVIREGEWNNVLYRIQPGSKPASAGKPLSVENLLGTVGQR